jgi:hypothetical protein
MTPTEVAFAFVEAINSKDLKSLASLMSVNHKFINGELMPENSWQVPCAWRVLVELEKVVEWQLRSPEWIVPKRKRCVDAA